MIKVENSKIVLNERELKARLHGADDSETIKLVEAYKDSVLDAMNCMAVIKESEVFLYDDGCDLGFGFIPSRNLRRNLEGCEKAYVFAATIGHDVDRILRNAAVTSTARHFITDAVASAAVEALCDYIQESVPETTKARFAPGYGDFDLSFQEKLLEYVNGEKIGISLSSSSLMNPMKTVTAIMGIKNEDNRSDKK